jgi:uncharacterized protein (TIGR02147 family)
MVTDHSDYRAFIALVYAEAKAADPSYSYVKLSEDLGLGSANAHSIINGRRPLTEKGAMKIAAALGLAGVQKNYLLALVRQDRAKTIGASSEAFETRMHLKQQLLPSDLDRRQLAFFEHWYHAAIMEMLRISSASDDPEWLSDHIRPQVSIAKVKESLELLSGLGYLTMNLDLGRLYPTDATISTGNEVSGIAVASFHRQMLKLAVEAIERVNHNDREVSAVTIGVSPELHAQLKDEIIALRKRFLQLAAEEKAATEVVQVNFQLFPLVKNGGRDR